MEVITKLLPISNNLIFSRSLQVKLDKPISEPDSPRSLNDFNYGSGDTAANLANNIRALKQVKQTSLDIFRILYNLRHLTWVENLSCDCRSVLG